MENLLASSIVKLAALAASYLVLAVAIKKTADWIEDVASESLRQDAHEWLSSFDAKRRVTLLAKTLSRLLRSLFGDNHWTIACFSRVVLATVFVIAVGGLLLVAFRPSDMSKALAMSNPVEWTVELLTLSVLLLGNYLSLWKSRLLIRFTRLYSFPLQAWCLLLLDILLSFGFVVVALNLTNVLLVGIDYVFVNHPDFYPSLTDPLTFASSTWRILTLRADIVPLWYLSVPSMWAAFVPAAVFSFFLFSRPMLRMAPYVAWIIALFRQSFDIQQKPFKSTAAAAIVLLATLYAAVLAPIALLS